jgi:hypothetical protein
VLPRAKHALVSSAMTVAAVDLDRAEIVGQTELPGGGRLVPWDREGSLLVWAYSFMGPAQGDIIPVGRGLAGKIGAAASNLVADLGTDGRTVVRLR